MNRHYPFSAIVGHQRLKTALLLAAIDRTIGGVLIEGPRGTAKSTMARALTDLLPEGAHRFVTLPLGASEERVVGSLDLEHALKSGDVNFSPGLLQRADQGILYVDEVNLLADHLVDLLLDVAASGVNLVERDGISHSHPARIILIGTMNPDEGELRPQLLDRFGLALPISNEIAREDRIEIVRRRLNFDQDPDAFIAGYAEPQQLVARQILEAREQLKTIGFEDDHLEHISHLCHQAKVEGLRADIVMLRAARAYAALKGEAQLDQSHIDYVAEFALHHRRSPETNASQSTRQSHATPPNDQSNEHQSSEGEWGEMPPQPVPTGQVRSVELKGKKKVI